MRTSSRHRDDIQGLRAVAVVLVALGHAGVPFLRGGFIGVDVFFVLSGFLITGILIAEARDTGSVSLGAFYARRARRILPAAALTLLVTDVAATLLLNFVRAKDAVWDSVFAAAFAANFRFADKGTDYFAQAQPPSPFLHFWSLGVEEQFYFAWPALLALTLFGTAVVTRRRRAVGRWGQRRLLLVVAVIGGASLGWSIHLTAALPTAAYFSPLTRCWELALGAGLAVAGSGFGMPRLLRVAAGWSGLLAIAVAAVGFSDETPFPGAAALLPTVGAALVIAAGIGDRRPRLAVGRLLELAPLRFVGDRSYAFYLWHWPVLIIAADYVPGVLSTREKLGLLLGAFMLSVVSYASFENPMRRARWTRAKGSLVFAASTALVVGAAVLSLTAIRQQETRLGGSSAVEQGPRPAVLVAAYSPVQERGSDVSVALPEVVAAVEAARRGARLPARLVPSIATLRNEPLPYSLPRGCVPVASSSQSSSSICRIGKTASSRSIVVIGDSHAQMWMPAVLRMAQRDGWVVIPLLRPGCTPDTWIAHRGLSACRPWFRWAVRQAKLLKPTLTLVAGAVAGLGGTAARAAESGMLSMARALGPASGNVVVIGDPQGLKRSSIDCLLARDASMAACTTTWPAVSFHPYENIAAGAAGLHVGFLDTQGWFCFERACPAVIGHTIAYKDYHHITAAYAIRLAWTFRAAVAREIRRA